VTLSLASGLLYVSELIEERSSLAKIIGQRGIYIIIILHGVLYFTESLPFGHTAFSALCHAIYLQNFSYTWPVISLTSVSFVASCVLVIADHFLWFFYFSRNAPGARHTPARRYGAYQEPQRMHSFAEIATFFGICVWLAPLFLFLSLSANDNALPITSVSHVDGSQAKGTNAPQSRSRSSLFKSVFGNITSQLPGVVRPRKDSEGIIAPRSPIPQSPQSFSFDGTSPRIPQRSSSIPPPPRSPVPTPHSEDTGGRFSPSLSSSSRLRPPSERLQQPTRRVTVEGLGLRRQKSSSLGVDE